MTSSLVLYEAKPPAVVLTINRADKRNALSRQLIADLTAGFQKARDDAGARAVILTGAGSVFCAGMDLADLAASSPSPLYSGERGWGEGASLANPPVPLTPGPSLTSTGERGEKPPQSGEVRSELVWQDALNLAALYDLIYTLPKPTIAAINGAAVAGGAGLVTVCDLALSVPEAKFGYPEVRRGLVAAMVMPHLLRHVGERMARYLLLTGELIDAAEAQRAGLINVVVSKENLSEKAVEWARSVAEGGPQALKATKSLLQQFSRQAISIEDAAQASAAPRLTEECKQGLEAFFNKQPAPWSPR
ncbi:MAG: enoyl-CoA hydratase-related protein [Gemmataceae bacterium]